MPKAILEFSLPEEAEEHKNAVNGGAWRGAVQAFDNELHNMAKRDDNEDRFQAAIEAVRTKLHDVVTMHGLEVWE